MSETERAWLAALDRELLISAFCHDARGPLTALDGACELASAANNSPLRLATLRLGGLVEALGERSTSRHATILTLAGAPADVPVLLATEPAPLYIAARRAAMPAAVPSVRGDRLVLTFALDRASGPTDWTMRIAQGWLAEAGPSLELARVRVAARMCGGSSSLEEIGAARALLTLVFTRATSKRG